jgi:copper transport protein
MVMITLEPGRVGANRARLDVTDGSFGLFDPRELVLTLSPQDGSLEPRDLVARRVTEGNWSIDELYIPLPGTWTFRIGALVSDFDRVDLASEYTFNR